MKSVLLVLLVVASAFALENRAGGGGQGLAGAQTALKFWGVISQEAFTDNLPWVLPNPSIQNACGAAGNF
jgi:hypothetical protein